MDDVNKASIIKVEWLDVAKQIAKVNPNLANMINDVEPGKNHYLYKVRYPFGAQILKNGVLQLPDQTGKLVPYDSPELPKEIQKDLNYNHGSNPITIVIKNTAELFTRIGHRLVPVFNLISEGSIFGLWNIFGTATDAIKKHNFLKTIFNSAIWELTAGSRFLFMLPKISRNLLHNRLVYKLQIESSIPKHLLDQWIIFKEINEKILDEKQWFLEVLFLPQSWVTSVVSVRWAKFYNFLMSIVWSNSEFWREKFIWDMIFAQMQENSNIRPDPYITNTVKHLFAISAGAVPGFAPAVNDSAGPIHKIQKIYKEIYNIEYDPIIMQPLAFDVLKSINRPVYYSLELPTTLELSPKTKAQSSKMRDLAQILHILNKFKKEIENSNLNLLNTQLYELAANVNYDFFHDEESHHQLIKSTNILPIEDKNFIVNKFSDPYNFPENSTFLRGCIRISTKNNLKK